jgi:EpsI family protein
MSTLSLRSFKSSSPRVWGLASALCGAALVAYIAQPSLNHVTEAPLLEGAVPSMVGEWQAMASPISQAPVSRNEGPDINQPYDQTLMRTYRDGNGHLVSIALAWGQKQRQEVKIHRPELCYPAQGLSVTKLWSHQFAQTSLSSGERIMGKRMLAQHNNGAIEAVSYWIRIGDSYSDSSLTTRLHILKEGLAGRYADGILVRVSQRVPNTSDAELEQVFQRQEKFLSELVKQVNPSVRDLLIR